jgi:uncharacterized protein
MAEKRPNRTLGPGHDTFWEHCAKGELRLQKCGSCSGLTWPVRETCELCGHGELTWERMSGRGKVVSWCSFERDYYHAMLPMPWDCILVELEEGPLFMSNPKGFTWRAIEPDMAVKVSFIACEDDGGAFSLPVFEQ